MMKNLRNLAGARAAVLLLGLCCGTAQAGRPLVVDDANVNEPGHGHLEAWGAHSPGSTIWSLAPAYAPVEGLELGALLARDRGAGLTLTALQAKWRITPSQDNGCNFGAVAGASHATGGGNTLYLNGLLSCNREELGSVHLNLGVARPRQGSTAMAWGIAYEREVMGFTPHVEWFGAEGSKPTFQLGLRTELMPGVQLDGSVGRNDGRSVFTLGTKFQF